MVKAKVIDISVILALTIQDHSRSNVIVPLDSPYATYYITYGLSFFTS